MKKNHAGLIGLTALALVSSLTIASTGPSSAAAQSRWCAGVKIDAFPAGPQGGAFAVNVYNGMLQAAKDLGPTVKYYWANWDPNVEAGQLKEAVAAHPDAIVGILGLIGDAAANPLIDQAWASGIIVSNANTSLTSDAKYNSRGQGFAGANLYIAGGDLAKEAIKRSGLKSGDEAFVWGLKGASGDRARRTVGIVDALTAAGIKVDYQEIDQATNSTPSLGSPTFVGELTAHPGIKAVFIDHGGMTAAAGVYMKAAGKAPGSLYVAGFDLSPATATAVTQGYISLVIDQQEWLEGYLPILQACLTKKYGFSGLNVNTSAGFVDKSNIAFIAPLANKLIR